MKLKVLLPSKIFVQQDDVARIVAETSNGSFGILDHRLDCVAELVPGILLYETQGAKTVYLAIDEGVLVKSGADVFVSVRRAIGGTDLGELEQAVKREFLANDQEQIEVRTAIANMEASLVARLVDYQHGQ